MVYEPSSLQSLWYSIKRYYAGLGMDMSDSIFDCVSVQLRAACKKLKQEGGGKLPNKFIYRIRTREDVEQDVQLTLRAEMCGSHRGQGKEQCL